MKEIKIGEIFYDPIRDKIVEIVGFDKDKFGQHATLYIEDKRQVGTTSCLLTTSYFVFKYWVKL